MSDCNDQSVSWHDGAVSKPLNKDNRSADKTRVHFEIEDKLSVKLDYDFAIALGYFLLESNVEDKRFKSFGHHLVKFDDVE